MNRQKSKIFERAQKSEGFPTCPKCDYEWVSRVAEPKACPRCKTRLDYPGCVKNGQDS